MTDLLTQAQRRGWRRLHDTLRGDTFLSERTVFVDPETSGMIWRMTCDPAVDSNDYYDKPAWNADGSAMSFLSWRSGERRRWLMDANGSNLRLMPTPEDDPVQDGYWSLVHRDRFIFSQTVDGTTRVLSLNPFTGELTELVSVEQDLGQMQPPHPSEEWFLFGRKRDGYSWEIADTPSTIYVLGLDGALETIELERAWHRLRFTKSDDRRIFFNYDGPRTQWTILPDGSERQEIPFTGSHPDWVPGGDELTFFAEGAVWGVPLGSEERHEIARLNSGGHGASTVDGDWFVTDTQGGTDSALYPNHILAFPLDGSSAIQRICTFNNSLYNHRQRWHPDHHTTHAHPTPSPDGTKALFNSDSVGDFSDVYVAVIRMPDLPTNLRQRVDGRSVILNWEEPEHAREIAGYNVYRSVDGGMTWKLLSFRPQRGTGWRGGLRKENTLYAVTAVEHSGLESAPTVPVYQLGDVYWEGPVCLRCQAESGEWTLPVSRFPDLAEASNGAYVACVNGEDGGRLWLPVSVPATRSYFIWARLRGKGSWKITLPDGQTSIACDSENWEWVRVSETHELTTGDTKLLFQPQTGLECLDMLFVTDVETYVPHGRMPLDEAAPPTPESLKVDVQSSNALRVIWDKVRAGDLDHYNVYRSVPGANVSLTQEYLVGSPTDTELVDWGLEPGKSYAYVVTSVSRLGSESPPTSLVSCHLPDFEMERVELTARKGKRTHMELVNLEGLDSRAAKCVGFDGSILWKFKLSQGGQYALWGRATHEHRKPCVFDVVLDDVTIGQWQAWGRWGQWLWSAMGSHMAGSPELFDLATGRHTLCLVPVTEDAVVADVVITNDATWWPLEGFSGYNMDVSY